MFRRRKDSDSESTTGDTLDPQGMRYLIQRFLHHQAVLNYSEATIEHRFDYLDLFRRWCEERGITRPAEITRQVIEDYQKHLYHLKKRDGNPISSRGQHARLIPVRAFFRWLARANLVLYNPAADIELPRYERRLPRAILTPEEAERILGQPDVTTPAGLRDRVILETLYSTGIRRMELCNLKLIDVDLERELVMVRQGKGKKDRVIPIGERACRWLEKYLTEVRPLWVSVLDDHSVFLTQDGESVTPGLLTKLVRSYVNAAEIVKPGSCHLFRHTMATAMLENGADIRYIQQMLGHADLGTTQIYTQVSIQKLKEIHTTCHPAARLRPRRYQPEAETTDPAAQTPSLEPEF